jgi:O-antigen/teichoic acid export membrane protein
MRVRPEHDSYSSDSAWSFGKKCIRLGWPIVLASTALGLVQSADRIVVSSALSIYDFAQYSLASSAMFVPVAAIAAVYRAFFPHVAAVEDEGRAKVYAHTSKFLLLAWSLLLPYYFVLEVLIRHFLPKYEPALPIAGILLIGVFFLAGIQILHTSFSSLHGKQRQFLVLATGALAVSLSLALVLSVWLHSLIAVAVGQVVALAIWWLANEWSLRGTTGQHWQDWLRMMALFGWSIVSYGISMRCTNQLVWQIPTYYLLVIFVLLLACRDEFRIGWELVGSTRATLPQ